MPRLGWLFAPLLLIPALARADEPLRTVIDRELSTGWNKQKLKPAPKASDSEFQRRVFIDLVGTVPTLEEITRFLADKDPKKRERLIDKLLTDPRFAIAQANIWDLVLFGRNPGASDITRVRPAFKAWLAKQFADGVAYDKWVKELLLAEQPGSEMFLAQFRGTPEDAAVNVSRLS